MAESWSRARDRNDREVASVGALGQTVTLLCECGHESCDEVLVATPAEYDEARERRLRLVSPEHERLAGGGLVARTDRFALVADE